LGRRYLIERELGQGGMGVVYLAHDRKHDRPVAIKVLPPDLAFALGPERFLREISIAARLSHPHILPLHDSGQAAGLLYYVMPFVEGESLRDRLARSDRLPVAEAVALVEEIADALDYAHAQGVVHRDVKPANIMLSGGHALLGDFGIARARGKGGEKLTESGLPIGTMGYMSPEQASGSSEVDGRSDIYSLGCVLYEMLAGSQVAEPILARRFSEPVSPLGELGHDLPHGIERAVQRAMSPVPSSRFPRPIDFARALREETSGAPPVKSRARARRMRWIAAATLTGIALVAAGAFAFLPRKTSDNARRVLIARFVNRTGDPTLAPLGDIATDYIARGLAATRLLDEVLDARTESMDTGAAAGAVTGLRQMALSMGAGTVVWGSYYNITDSVHFEASILEAGSGKVLLALQPVAGPRARQTEVVETLRQRIMAGFAVLFGPGFESWQAQSVPPTYDAYQEMLAGEAAAWSFDFDIAFEHYQRATALDPSYVGARVSAAVVSSEADRCADVDSLARALKSVASPLSPAEQGQLDWALASCRGDFEGTLEAGKRVLEAAPRNVGWAVMTAIRAAELFRPREVLTILRRLDPLPARFVASQEAVYWTAMLSAYHQLGDFEEELRAATRQSRNGLEAGAPPDAAGALAGLGRTEEVERLATGWLDGGDTGTWTGGRVQCAALELRAHGQTAAGHRLLERVAAWFRAHPPEISTTDAVIPCLWHLLSAEYYAGQWSAARASYEALAADTTSTRARFGLAAVAAREGRQEDVARLDQWLLEHDDHYDRARLAAIQGRRADAVALIQRSFDQGLLGRMYMHYDPDLDSLHGYPPYEELLRPKD
jgi:tetratricopeptide (TPR) repeat protein